METQQKWGASAGSLAFLPKAGQAPRASEKNGCVNSSTDGGSQGERGFLPLTKASAGLPRASEWIDTAGREAAWLSAIEIGLGSLLHGFKVPFTGFFLSLNQGFILTRAVLKTKKRNLPFLISNIVAILKSLSPAGQRLTPMLAISMQGLLYSLGTIIFGVNLLGIVVGFCFLSLWAFVQPVLIYYFLFGETLFQAGEYFYKSINKDVAFDPQNILVVAAILVGLKLLLASGLALAAYFLPDKIVFRYQSLVLKAGESKRKNLNLKENESFGFKQKALLALKDLFNPLFLVCLGLTALFFFVVQADQAKMVWGLLRPVAGGFILFLVIRLISFERLIRKLEAWGAPHFSESLKKAVETLKQI